MFPARKNICTVTNADLKWSGHVFDEKLFEQFMLATNFDLNYNILIDSPLAFPSISQTDRPIIRNLIRKKRFYELVIVMPTHIVA